MTHLDDIPSDEEYLSMKDWTFSPRIAEGKTDNFHWLKIDGYRPPFEMMIALPPSYRILMLSFDGWGGGALRFGNSAGWRTLGECAISDIRTGFPEVQGNADMSWAVVEPDSKDEDILPQLKVGWVNASEDDPIFWTFLNLINPYFFFELGNGLFFAARDKSTIASLNSPEFLKQEGEAQRIKEFEGRKGFLKYMETDCEPEKCRELDCNRRRMKLSVLCHWHQRKKFK